MVNQNYFDVTCNLVFQGKPIFKAEYKSLWSLSIINRTAGVLPPAYDVSMTDPRICTIRSCSGMLLKRNIWFRVIEFNYYNLNNSINDLDLLSFLILLIISINV